MYRLNKTLVFFLIFTIISSALAFKIVVSAYNTFDNVYDESYVPQKLANASDSGGSKLIGVSFPKPNTVIQSPLVVQGKEVGTWYFEASFPVRLLDANGKELAATPAQAQGDWRTTDFVPFQATLTFGQPTTPTGTLVFQKDNPSGLPENEKSISVPIRFSP